MTDISQLCITVTPKWWFFSIGRILIRLHAPDWVMRAFCKHGMTIDTGPHLT